MRRFIPITVAVLSSVLVGFEPARAQGPGEGVAPLGTVPVLRAVDLDGQVRRLGASLTAVVFLSVDCQPGAPSGLDGASRLGSE